MADYVNKIKKRSEIYRIEDTATKESLVQEIERAVSEEEKIRGSMEGIKAKAESNQVRINILEGTGDGSIQKMIDASIAQVIDKTPETFDTLKELADWIDDDKTGAANMSTAITENKVAIEEIKSGTIYLSESEWQHLVNNNLVQPDVEYNIYEE